MSKERTARTVREGGASYVGYRAELLAKVALSRFQHLTVHTTQQDYGYDFLVATPEGKCFFVIVKAFSSIRLKIRSVATVRELRWRIDQRTIDWAASSPNPVFLFLIDADTDHGRYLRLNNLPLPKVSGQTRTIRLPLENTIDEEGLQRLIAGL